MWQTHVCAPIGHFMKNFKPADVTPSAKHRPLHFQAGDAPLDDHPETPSQRVQRIYTSPGGPLCGWLYDEARRRGHNLREMAQRVGVTYGYIVQLRSGHRSCANLSQIVVEGCARYLGVPAIVVKLVAGVVSLSDFAFPYESEEQMVDRMVRRVLDDPQVRASVPVDIESLPLESKKAVVSLYAEAVQHELVEARSLPNILQWLQRAAVIHDEHEGLAGDSGVC